MQPIPENSIVIVGAGGHSTSCIDVVKTDGRFKIVGLIGRRDEVGKAISGITVIGVDADLGSPGNLVAGFAIVAVGQIRSPDSRIRLFDYLSVLGYKLPSIISPMAYLSEASTVQAGTVVMHGAIVNAGAQVGVNCIINSRALLEHGVTVGAHCHISTAAVVNGDATIGEGTFVGSGAVIREGIRIGSRCVIGMGVLVKHDLPDGAILVGNTGHGA